MKIFKKIISFLVIPCYGVIIALILILAPMVVGYHPVVVLSGSMEPAYPVGSLIYYKSASFNSIEKGDAITFYIDEDTLVTHRVVVKNDISQTFITRGDANGDNDSNPVTYQNVAGKTLDLAIPVVGRIFASTQKYLFATVIMIVLFLNVILSNLKSKKKLAV